MISFIDFFVSKKLELIKLSTPNLICLTRSRSACNLFLGNGWSVAMSR